MITFQEFMLTSKHFCLIRSDIPFRLICNPNGGDWLSGTDICNLPAGSFTFDFWKLLPEKYFKNNPAFKLGLAYDADLLTDGRKIDVSYSDLNYGSGVAGLAGSAESSLAEIILIDTLISNNLLAALQKLETGNVSLASIQSVLNDDIKQDVSDIQTSIEDNIAPDLSNASFDVGEIKAAIGKFFNGNGIVYIKKIPRDDTTSVFTGLYTGPRTFKCMGSLWVVPSGDTGYFYVELKEGYCVYDGHETKWYFFGDHQGDTIALIVHGTGENPNIWNVDATNYSTLHSLTIRSIEIVF